MQENFCNICFHFSLWSIAVSNFARSFSVRISAKEIFISYTQALHEANIFLNAAAIVALFGPNFPPTNRGIVMHNQLEFGNLRQIIAPDFLRFSAYPLFVATLRYAGVYGNGVT